MWGICRRYRNRNEMNETFWSVFNQTSVWLYRSDFFIRDNVEARKNSLCSYFVNGNSDQRIWLVLNFEF